MYWVLAKEYSVTNKEASPRKCVGITVWFSIWCLSYSRWRFGSDDEPFNFQI